MSSARARVAVRLFRADLPRVPYRQWVLSFDPPLAVRLGYDARALALVCRSFARRVYQQLRRLCKRHLGLRSVAALHPALLVVVQRFRSDCGLLPAPAPARCRRRVARASRRRRRLSPSGRLARGRPRARPRRRRSTSSPTAAFASTSLPKAASSTPTINADAPSPTCDGSKATPTRSLRRSTPASASAPGRSRSKSPHSPPSSSRRHPNPHRRHLTCPSFLSWIDASCPSSS
jgi:hypothetical protein